MIRQPERSQETIDREALWVEKAKQRGFKKGVRFLSASGSKLKGTVQGDMTMRWVEDEQDEDQMFNGNIMSSGNGCIYIADTDTWAEIIS